MLAAWGWCILYQIINVAVDAFSKNNGQEILKYTLAKLSCGHKVNGKPSKQEQCFITDLMIDTVKF